MMYLVSLIMDKSVAEPYWSAVPTYEYSATEYNFIQEKKDSSILVLSLRVWAPNTDVAIQRAKSPLWAKMFNLIADSQSLPKLAAKERQVLIRKEL